MSVQELIEYPRFADLEAKVQSKQTAKVLLTVYCVMFALIGMVLLGLPMVVFSSEMGPDFFLTLGLGLVLIGLAFLSYRGAKKAGRSAIELKAEIGNRTNEYLVSERRRLEEVKNSMSVAEWETYKLQLQNQRLLRDIKNKPSGGRSTSTTTTSWVAEISD